MNCEALLAARTCRLVINSQTANFFLFFVIFVAIFQTCAEGALQPKQTKQQLTSGHYRSLVRKDSEWISSYLELERERETHYRRTQFIEKLFYSYDRRVLPNLDSPTVVNCSLFINNFDSISEVTMDYAVGVYLRQAWVDPRLKFDPAQNNNESMVTLDAKSFDKLWVPDLFFTNEKRASFHSITVPNRLIRLTPVGTVLYSVRLSLTLSCVMDLRKFPLDSQICTMMIESYAYTTDKIVLQWRSDPLEVSPDLMIPQFNLRTFDFADCSKRYATGNFSCLKASFYLDRDVGYYIIQTYLPSVLVVVLSWVAFWIDPTAVPARVTFGVFTTLILSTMSSSVRSTLPRVSYVKAIDVWMSVCMFFVFTALIEYAIVNVVLRQKPKKPSKPPQQPQQQRAVVNNSRTPANEPQANPAMSHLLSSHGEGYGENLRNPNLQDDRQSKPYQRGNAKHSSSNNSVPEIWIPLETQQQTVPQISINEPSPPSSVPDSTRDVPQSKDLPSPDNNIITSASQSSITNNNNNETAPAAATAMTTTVVVSSSTNDNNEVVIDNVDTLLIRGPTTPFDLCFYWHRMFRRMAEMEGKEKGQMVENWARKIFPLSFLIFNIVYWIVYLYYI